MAALCRFGGRVGPAGIREFPAPLRVGADSAAPFHTLNPDAILPLMHQHSDSDAGLVFAFGQWALGVALAVWHWLSAGFWEAGFGAASTWFALVNTGCVVLMTWHRIKSGGSGGTKKR